MLDPSISKTTPTLFVNIGLTNGVLLRTVLDPIDGSLTDTRTRFLGVRPVKLVRVKLQGSTAVLALSSRAWLNYVYQDQFQFTPLLYETLDHAWSFSAEVCPEGFIGITGSVLRFVPLSLSLSLSHSLLPRSVPLRLTSPFPKNIPNNKTRHKTKTGRPPTVLHPPPNSQTPLPQPLLPNRIRSSCMEC